MSFWLVFLSFRCATRSECAPQVCGSMSTAGKREWSVVSERNEIRTAAKEKISPEELTISTRRTRGKYQHLYLLAVEQFINCKIM